MAHSGAAAAAAAVLFVLVVAFTSSVLASSASAALRGPGRSVLESAAAPQHQIKLNAPGAAAGAADAPPAPGAAPGPGAGAALLSAQVVFRHGARSPLSGAFYGDREWECDETYDGPSLDLINSRGGPPPPLVDAAAPPLKGGCPQGTLTQRGFRMALDLGAELRRRYVYALKLLPEGPPRPGAVFAHTTSFRRTVATLRGVLSGLFPAGPARYPANVTDEPFTYFYPSNRSCAALGPVISDLTAGADAREAAAPRAAADAVRAALGLGPDDGRPLAWYRLRDALACMLAESPEEWPEGLDDATWALIQRRATDYEASIYAPGPWDCPGPAPRCRELLRLSIGPLLWRVLSNAQRASDERGACEARAVAAAAGAAAAGKGGKGGAGAGVAAKACGGRSEGSPVMYLYSAHDTTVMPLLSALGYEAREWAPFTAHVEFQTWAAAGGAPWVRVLYNGQPLPIRGAAGAAAAAAAAGGRAAGAGGERAGGGAWRRAAQEQAAAATGKQQQQQQQQQQAAGGGSDGGWIELGALRARLGDLAVSDGERAEACWPRHSEDGL